MFQRARRSRPLRGPFKIMRLSPRLEALLTRCVPGFPVWDLCCDHGLVGLAALESGKFTAVIFNDSVEHLLNLLKPKINGRADCRIVHAFAEEISEPLTGNLVLAGIGGEKIYKILSTHAERQTLKAQKIIV